jgi:hypothetical protein
MHALTERTKLRYALAAGSLAASVLCAHHASAQSADAIIDKLVEKGILTQQEATDLREQADANFTTAHQAKTGLPDWVTSLHIHGDVRGRYEGFYSDNPGFVDRHRLRYRLRFGATALMLDGKFEAGFRLGSGDLDSGTNGGTDPISNNQTFQNNASKKGVFVDLAYGKWTQLNYEGLSTMFTMGKMENPFMVSDMVFDGDYTPEGLAQQVLFTRHFGEATHNWKLNLGGFMLDELGAQSEDPWLFGAQVHWDTKWTRQLDSALGVGVYTLTHKQYLGNADVPNINVGNTRVDGAPAYNFNPIVADASLTYSLEAFPFYNGMFPIKVAGEFMKNPAAPDRNTAWWAGVTFGKAGKLGTWEVGYRYKHLEADAWYEEVVDSDFGAFWAVAPPGSAKTKADDYNGTNVKGHIVKLSYSPFDSTTFTLTYFITELIKEPTTPAGVDRDSSMGRLQADIVWKF